MNTSEKNQIINYLCEQRPRSAWGKGVIAYAVDMLNGADVSAVTTLAELTKALLNGAGNWEQYSYGGCALIYDSDIAATLCTPSELKRTRNGERNPNARENWLDVQARALYQAAAKIRWAARCHGLR